MGKRQKDMCFLAIGEQERDIQNPQGPDLRKVSSFKSKILVSISTIFLDFSQI